MKNDRWNHIVLNDLKIIQPSISILAALSKGMLVGREHPHLQSNLEGKIQVACLQAMASGQWVSLDEVE